MAEIEYASLSNSLAPVVYYRHLPCRPFYFEFSILSLHFRIRKLPLSIDIGSIDIGSIDIGSIDTGSAATKPIDARTLRLHIDCASGRSGTAHTLIPASHLTDNV